MHCMMCSIKPLHPLLVSRRRGCGLFLRPKTRGLFTRCAMAQYKTSGFHGQSRAPGTLLSLCDVISGSLPDFVPAAATPLVCCVKVKRRYAGTRANGSHNP